MLSMSTKPKPQATGKDPGKDISTFKELPENTKDLMELKEQDEKATGSEHIENTREIEDKGKESKS